MPFKRTTGLLITLLIAACDPNSGAPPQIVVDRTACSHCTMLISEPRYAAAYQGAGVEAKVFDDIGCLIEAARTETTTGLRYWFQDASGGGWIEGDAAIFVASPEIRTPMSGGILAYRDAAAAEQAAGKYRGRVVRSLPELMKEKGEQ